MYLKKIIWGARTHWKLQNKNILFYVEVWILSYIEMSIIGNKKQGLSSPGP
jgi:hypothetical protein